MNQPKVNNKIMKLNLPSDIVESEGLIMKRSQKSSLILAAMLAIASQILIKNKFKEKEDNK